MRTHSLDDIFGIFHVKTLGQLDKRYLIVFEAIGLSAFQTGEMNVIEVLTVGAAAYAILLLTAAVVNLVQQVMLDKKPKRTEYARPVHVGHPSLHVAKGECLLLTRSLFPHQYSHCRGLHSMFCQMFLYSFHFCHYSILIYYEPRPSPIKSPTLIADKEPPFQAVLLPGPPSSH